MNECLPTGPAMPRDIAIRTPQGGERLAPRPWKVSATSRAPSFPSPLRGGGRGGGKPRPQSPRDPFETPAQPPPMRSTAQISPRRCRLRSAIARPCSISLASSRARCSTPVLLRRPGTSSGGHRGVIPDLRGGTSHRVASGMTLERLVEITEIRRSKLKRRPAHPVSAVAFDPVFQGLSGGCTPRKDPNRTAVVGAGYDGFRSSPPLSSRERTE
ncbi:hypothetical protein C8N35_11173 [Breoghania corrubedonensis]|uniref:Uncharacterized protein n=1 Tax=Breoghania corrubedonensis TaxID=665038 RepID=A0A2T5UYP7_9HYPH|nr:hypothetical protein C8N35_11173 [Breoghania corrubedonensis]